MRRCISFMVDKDRRNYVIRTQKEAEFRAWLACVNGGKQKYYGEDFSDYQFSRPLATLLLENPYGRFRRRRARLRGLRDIRDVRDN
jgi:hypothetical protein